MKSNLPQSVKNFLTDLKVASPKLGAEIEQVCNMCYSQGRIDGMDYVQLEMARLTNDTIPDSLTSTNMNFTTEII